MKKVYTYIYIYTYVHIVTKEKTYTYAPNFQALAVDMTRQAGRPPKKYFKKLSSQLEDFTES